jgi:TonB family protein
VPPILLSNGNHAKLPRMTRFRVMAVALLALASLTAAQAQQPTDSASPILKVGVGVTPPKVIYEPQPEYSEEARRAGFEGICTLWLIVGVDGTPYDVRVVHNLGMGLDEKAVEAVRGWRFQPAQKDGKPVPVKIAVEVDFHLYERPKRPKLAELSKKAAAHDPKAEFELAEAYLQGRRVPQDEQEGMVLLEKASNHGLAQAQFALAERIIHSSSPDYPKAYMWYALAQRGGEKRSNKALQNLTAQMTPDQLQTGQALVDNWTQAPR